LQLKIKAMTKLDNNAPLFDYLEEVKKEETAIKVAQNKIMSLKKTYIANALLGFFIIFSICFVFYAQFKTDNMQRRLDLSQVKIDEYKNQLKLLNVEWCYLTRPNRLRFLSKKYLKSNKYTAFNQIKNYDKLEKYYLAKVKRINSRITQNSH